CTNVETAHATACRPLPVSSFNSAAKSHSTSHRPRSPDEPSCVQPFLPSSSQPFLPTTCTICWAASSRHFSTHTSTAASTSWPSTTAVFSLGGFVFFFSVAVFVLGGLVFFFSVAVFVLGGLVFDLVKGVTAHLPAERPDADRGCRARSSNFDACLDSAST